MINRAKLLAVLNLSPTHRPQLVQVIINMLQTAEGNIEKILALAQQRQSADLQQTLHKIRGGYATLGAEQLAEASRAIEHELENNAVITDTTIAEFISLYRQTCVEMQAELSACQTAMAADRLPLNIPQLYTMLTKHDMQAGQLAQSCQFALTQLLAPAGATRFFQLIAGLNFNAAAQMIEPYLTSDNENHH